ncbi:ATP-dependent DNA helicase [Poseidonibacter antarcticus]|uniref:ATP-dependent DNA helicase n=1 Tax=Poseidonibacter antarcticus TaxID=2478538 RepID=UPI000EF47A02|nr:AAA family ATPase [Poseidonibacter antarcticus]
MQTSSTQITTQNKAFEQIAKKIDTIIKTNMVWENEVSLSGAAGTGKTYLTTKLVKKLDEFFHITITAPTHKALQVLRANLLTEGIENVDTKTIQSFLNIKLVTDYDKGIQKFEPIKSKDKDDTKTDLLIVDESSMVSSDIYAYIIQAIEKLRVKAVLYVGDEFQLLPVDNQHNKVFEISHKYKLDKIVRQAQGSYIINMATKARNIIKSKQYISIKEFFSDESFKNKVQFINSKQEFYDDFCTPDTWAKNDKVIASFRNNSVDQHNKAIRKRYWQEQGISTPQILQKGDKVIFQQANVIDSMVVHQNSDIVEIASTIKIFEKKLKVEFWDCKDLAGRPFKVIDPNSKGRFETILSKIAKEAKQEKDYGLRTQKWKIFYAIKEMFIDVKYIFASTIHKLQGSTYETVYIDLTEIENMRDKDMMFRLLYVAITRASKDVKVLLPDNKNTLLSEYQDNVLNSIDEQFSMLGLDL